MADLDKELEPYKDSCVTYDKLIRYIDKVNTGIGKLTSIIHLNIRSLRKNWQVFNALLENECKNSINIIVLTEISLYENENSLYKIKGFNTVCYNRTNQKGGGLGVYVKEEITIEVIKVGKSTKSGFEYIHIEVDINDTKTEIVAIYRPPDQNIRQFIEDLALLLGKINHLNDVILIGDINIDLLLLENGDVNNYLNMLSENGLVRCVYGVTREEIRNGKHIKSCIDHIFIRTGNRISSAIVHTHISDHYMVATSIYNKSKKTGQNNYCKLHMDQNVKYDDKKIVNMLKNIKWDEKIGNLNQTEIDTEGLYNMLKKEFLDVYTAATVRNKKSVDVNKSRMDKNWITGEIKNEIKIRDALFKRWKNTSTNAKYRDEYKVCRNKVNNMIRDRKNEYFRVEIEKVKGNIKKTWKKVNELIGRGNRENIDEKIIKHFSKQYSISDILNSFAMEFTRGIEQKIHVCDIRMCKLNPREMNMSMYIPKAKESDIDKIIKNMKCKKAPGDDKIRAIDIRNNKDKIIPVLTKLINLSLEEGVVPSAMKTALVKPIYKQGKVNVFSNYRPIAILSSVEKILETYVSIHVKKYLNSNHIINKKQYGFQKGRGTINLLQNFADHVYAKLNTNKIILVLFIDFTKAFDMINHKILLQTLEGIGFRGKILKWFENYLDNRSMKVKVFNETSNETKVKYGVPQGSILGPLLYTLYVNNVFECIKNCMTYMFADDTALLSVNNNIDEAQHKLQQDYNNLLIWSHDNGLIVNEKKTKVMCITTSKRNIIGVNIISHTVNCLHMGEYKNSICNCPKIKEVKEMKYLGVIMDSRFLWSSHVEQICKSLRGCLSQFYRLKYCVSLEILLETYYALVNSIIRYGLQLYGNCAATQLKKVEVLHKQIIKIIATKKCREEIMENLDRYKSLNILPVNQLFKYILVLQNCFKTEYKVVQSEIYNLRNKKLKIPLSYNKYGERQSCITIAKLMNSIPQEIREIEGMSKIKKELKNWLLK